MNEKSTNMDDDLTKSPQVAVDAPESTHQERFEDALKILFKTPKPVKSDKEPKQKSKKNEGH